MNEVLKNCWEIKECGREKGGCNEEELGECIASKKRLGHSCWAIAGTLCDGKASGTYAQKIEYCVFCEVYRLYNRNFGIKGNMVGKYFRGEEQKYIELMVERHEKRKKYKHNKAQ